jgi:hypothetical protein
VLKALGDGGGGNKDFWWRLVGFGRNPLELANTWRFLAGSGRMARGILAGFDRIMQTGAWHTASYQT